MTITQRTVSGVIINVSSKDKSWRLVHDGESILSLKESEGFTETKWNLFLAATWKECIDEANRIGLSNVPEFVAKALNEKLEASYMELKVKGERPIEFAASILSTMESPDTFVEKVDVASSTIASTRSAAGTITLKEGSVFGTPVIKVKP